MKLVADTHVHLYPFYDLPAAVRGLEERLAALAPGAVKIAFLAERADCDVFAAIRNGEAGPPDAEWRTVSGTVCLEMRRAGVPALYVFAGRQVVTAERIEILALATGSRFADGQSAADTLAAIRRAGGVPVLSWAPGKWLFKRRRIVRRLIETATPGQLLIGDTTLRPKHCPESPLMKAARVRGLAVVAGSDPLPFRGEESIAGTYATTWDAEFDPADPLASIRRTLTAATFAPGTLGRRSCPCTVALRLWRNARARRGQGSRKHWHSRFRLGSMSAWISTR